MPKRTLAVLAAAAFGAIALPFGLPTIAHAVGPTYTSVVMAPLPIEQPGTLAIGGIVTLCAQPLNGPTKVPGATVYISLFTGLFTSPPATGGSASAEGTPLTTTPQPFVVQATCTFANAESTGTIMDAVPITYTGPNPIPINGRDVIIAADSVADSGSSGSCPGSVPCTDGTYVFSPVHDYVFSPVAPIAPTGSLGAGAPVTFTVTAQDVTLHAVPSAFLDLSIQSAGGSATAVNSFTHNQAQHLTNLVTRLGSDPSGSITITYTAANPLPSTGSDTIIAQNHPTETVEATDSYSYSSTGPLPSNPYTAVSPFRVCDTRPVAPGIASNPCNTGVGSGPITSGASRAVTVTGGVVPSTATAVVVNLTAIAPTQGTFVTLYPTGQTRPNTSNVNPRAGAVVANLVEVAVGTSGNIQVFNDLGTINVALDIEGYVDSTSTGTFNAAAAPVRICDTRAAGGGVPANRCNTSGVSPIGAGVTLTFNVNGVPSPVPGAGVTAVVFNLTAIAPTKATVLTAFAGGTSRPVASNLNLNAGAAVPNRVIVPVTCAAGNCTVSIWNSVGSVNIAVDIDGWFTTGTTVKFTALTPARVCNTQFGNSSDFGCAKALIGPGHVLNIDVAGIGGVPIVGGAGSPIAVVINVTAVNATATTFITVYPGPAGSTRPNASDLNVPAAQTETNLVVVAVGSDGTISLFNDLGNVNLIVDVSGYYS
jgi:hypothetical protein